MPKFEMPFPKETKRERPLSVLEFLETNPTKEEIKERLRDEKKLRRDQPLGPTRGLQEVERMAADTDIERLESALEALERQI